MTLYLHNIPHGWPGIHLDTKDYLEDFIEIPSMTIPTLHIRAQHTVHYRQLCGSKWTFIMGAKVSRFEEVWVFMRDNMCFQLSRGQDPLSS